MLATFKLFPGAVNFGEQVNLSIANMGYSRAQWVGVQCALSISGVSFPDRPGSLFIDHDSMWPSGDWSCIIHFPVMSEFPALSGVHTLLVRTIVGPGVNR